MVFMVLAIEKNFMWCTVQNVEDFFVKFLAAIFLGNWRTKIGKIKFAKFSPHFRRSLAKFSPERRAGGKPAWQMDAEGLGRKLLLTHLVTPGFPPEKQTVSTVTASDQRGCVGQGKAFGWPPAICPPKRPRPFTHFRECREEHSMDQCRSRLKLWENFERRWSIPISGEIHMDQSLVHTFSWGNSYAPMVHKVLLKFPSYTENLVRAKIAPLQSPGLPLPLPQKIKVA